MKTLSVGMIFCACIGRVGELPPAVVDAGRLVQSDAGAHVQTDAGCRVPALTSSGVAAPAIVFDMPIGALCAQSGLEASGWSIFGGTAVCIDGGVRVASDGGGDHLLYVNIAAARLESGRYLVAARGAGMVTPVTQFGESGYSLRTRIVQLPCGAKDGECERTTRFNLFDWSQGEPLIVRVYPDARGAIDWVRLVKVADAGTAVRLGPREFETQFQRPLMTSIQPDCPRAHRRRCCCQRGSYT